MCMNLTNKVVVVTGSSDWIGKEIVLKLAATHAVVVCLARNAEKLEAVCELAKEVWAADAYFYPCDVSDTAELGKTVAKIVSDLWWIDVLVNNAWIRQKLSPLESIDESVVDSVIDVNLTWLIHCTRLFLPSLKAKEEAAIVNISSRAWVTSQEWLSVYTASKYWVRWFTEVLKTDLKWSSVRVAWVYQAWTNTSMFEKTGEDFPVEKFTDPQDLADVIVYMLSLPKKIWLHDVRVEF